jgi:hypothetical protein
MSSASLLVIVDFNTCMIEHEGDVHREGLLNRLENVVDDSVSDAEYALKACRSSQVAGNRGYQITSSLQTVVTA